MGPVLRRWTFACTLSVCCSFSCIAQGSCGLSLRERGSRICRQSRCCCCGWFSQDLWVLHISICVNPETMSTFISCTMFCVPLFSLIQEKNHCIREKTGAQNIVKEIKQYQKKWLQHVQRMGRNRLPRQALKYRAEGRRNIGRPKKRWRDQLHFED